MEPITIDVREKDEFAAEHIADSIHIPLSNFDTQAPGIMNNLKDRRITLICRSGTRAKLAKEQLRHMGFVETPIDVYEGGIVAWKAAGNAVKKSGKQMLPVLRQAQMAAGFLALTFSLLALFVNSNFAFGSAFVGCGLLLAGTTGFCGMAELMSKMPWNRND